MRRRALAGLAVAACAGAVAGQAGATDELTPAADLTPPPGTFRLPAMTLRIVPTQITVGTQGQMTFSAGLTRRLDTATLEMTLPRPWLRASPADGRRQARTPLQGSGSSRVRVRRSGRLVRFTFGQGRRGASGRYTVTDRSLPPATYRLRFVLRIDGRVEATATASVVVVGRWVRVPEG